jgi:hypothetical protein
MTNNTFRAARPNTLVRSWRATAGAGSPLVCTWIAQPTHTATAATISAKGGTQPCA